MDNAEVTKRIRAALEHEPRVNLHRDRVVIEFSAGVATLSGEVEDIAAKRIALELTAAQPPVEDVVDRLHVRPAERMGDGAIAAHIERTLIEDSAFGGFALNTRVRGRKHGEETPGSAQTGNPPMAQRARGSEAGSPGGPWIEIGVDEGVVTLDGEVPSLSHKRLAGAVAWWAPGSRDVINGLGVVPEDADTEAEILDALRIVLEKDPTVDASQIAATCQGAVITLQGLVRNESERAAAEFDAWALFGVDRVVNRIAVR